MKKLLFTILTIFFISPVFAQSGVKVGLCGKYPKSTSESKLLKCAELTVNNEDWEIKTFTIEISMGSKIIRETADGNEFNGKMYTLIKKLSPKKVYFEKIELVNKKSNKREVKSFDVTLK